MKITATAVSLTVDDVPASAAFLAAHFGFQEVMAADGFASLVRDDAVNVIFLRRGIEVLAEGMRDQHAAGVITAFTVDDLDAEYERLQAEGVAVTMPLREEPWGERLFQVTDPNGVIFQLVSWRG
ncbi:VOC family protein [Herbidospora sp. RD11066]